jgi:Tfp pilus assembly protein PilV
MANAEHEAGFSLLEVIVCTGLLIAGAVLALAALPALARGSQTQVMREAATTVARNAIERARAAAAYDPPAAMADSAQRAATAATHAWALAPATTYASAVRVRRALCGGANASTDIAFDVTLTYDAASDAVTASVAYPPDPCAAQTRATVALTAVLAPAALAPQTRMLAPIADPAQQ